MAPIEVILIYHGSLYSPRAIGVLKLRRYGNEAMLGTRLCCPRGDELMIVHAQDEVLSMGRSLDGCVLSGSFGRLFYTEHDLSASGLGAWDGAWYAVGADIPWVSARRGRSVQL